ncbi:hypothetical protein MOE47_05910 [Bacillus atrophaeus]|uniref:hypothetical protein n=1 Tax=Bacillus atrophaeus TaxID=1452 RepID=UPI0022805158|nr:hypothetical protein [Bacillus atrophaeus]MCY8912536.1 hypothetical protein [Bacillus atrophaeus]MCY9113966.1 hypothetical protein [Bacillus atrophaeus]MEC0927089.1 hypothetical protein [Bacillus atrophaeus]MEC0932071.1 hypothetical protein [Bacillus atrophaeus]
MSFEFLEVIKGYLPVIAVFVSAFIAFISTIRHKDLERFYKNAEINLEKTIEPMYYKIKYITGISDTNQKLKNINGFFDTYNSKLINISKLGNRQLIELFLETENILNQYISHKDDKTKEVLLSRVRRLHREIEKEYWRLFETIYKDYNWYKKTVDMNYVFRWSLRVSFIVEQTLYAVTWIFFTALFILLFCQIFGGDVALEPKDFHEKFYVIMLGAFSSLIALYFFMFVNYVFADDTKQKKRFMDYATAGLTSVIDKIYLKIKDWIEKRNEQEREDD